MLLALVTGLVALFLVPQYGAVLDEYGGYEVTVQRGGALAVLGPVVMFISAWLAKPELWRASPA